MDADAGVRDRLAGSDCRALRRTVHALCRSRQHLPLRIASKSHVAPLGDVAIAPKFGEFIDTATGGVKIPGRMTKLVDDTVIAELRITKAVVNPSVYAPGQLNAPASVRGAPDSRRAR